MATPEPSEARRRQILELARGEGRVRVTELATVLDVAAETVRRDLRSLEDLGLVRRTHGGALPVDRSGFETRMAQRSVQSASEKQRIAGAAVGLLEGCESVFVDEGSTALAVAHQLLEIDRPLTVVTHSVPVVVALSGRPRSERDLARARAEHLRPGDGRPEAGGRARRRSTHLRRCPHQVRGPQLLPLRRGGRHRRRRHRHGPAQRGRGPLPGCRGAAGAGLTRGHP